MDEEKDKTNNGWTKSTASVQISRSSLFLPSRRQNLSSPRMLQRFIITRYSRCPIQSSYFPWYNFAARVISCQRGSRILQQIEENAENEGNIMLLLWMVSVRIDEEMGKGAKEDKSDVVGKYKPLTVSSTRRWRNKVVVDASDLLLNNAYRQKGKE